MTVKTSSVWLENSMPAKRLGRLGRLGSSFFPAQPIAKKGAKTALLPDLSNLPNQLTCYFLKKNIIPFLGKGWAEIAGGWAGWAENKQFSRKVTKNVQKQ